jgi:hypothetical protein
MGRVRNALRVYALEGHPPAGVLERVTRLLDSFSIEELVTCCDVELSPDDSAGTIALAGHPPPLPVTAAGDAALLEVEPSLILGVDTTTVFAETTVLLPPGATLALYTDGLTDPAAHRGGDGTAAVLSAAQARAPDRSTGPTRRPCRRPTGRRPVPGRSSRRCSRPAPRTALPTTWPSWRSRCWAPPLVPRPSTTAG